jgi:adenine/guanine phosphoribosyltransferase-like PRPP-binding protein
MTTCVLLSNSMVKKQAFFQSDFGTITDHLKCINAMTDTPQPIGNMNAFNVANQRINNYIKEHNDNTNIIISIESYLDLSKNENKWYEKCVIVIKWQGSTIHKVSNILVNVDNSLIDILFQNSNGIPLGRDITLGSIIADIYNTASDNWYECFNKFDRVYHIKQTLNDIICDVSYLIDNMIKTYSYRGSTFIDIIPLFADRLILSFIMYMIKNKLPISEKPYDYVISFDTRSCIMGSMIANELKCGFAMICSEWFIPSSSYEDGGEHNKYKIQDDIIKQHSKILVVDDIINSYDKITNITELLNNFKPSSIDFFAFINKGGDNKPDNLFILF